MAKNELTGSDFKKFRNDLNLTQQEIADVLHIKSGRMYVSFIEKRADRNVPNEFWLFVRYSNLFGIKTAMRHFESGWDDGST